MDSSSTTVSDNGAGGGNSGKNDLGNRMCEINVTDNRDMLQIKNVENKKHVSLNVNERPKRQIKL